MGLSLSLVRHPLEGIDVLTESNLKVLHHLGHALLVAFREILLYIHLADRL